MRLITTSRGLWLVSAIGPFLAAACTVGTPTETTFGGGPMLGDGGTTSGGEVSAATGIDPATGNGSGDADSGSGSAEDTVGPPCGDMMCDANAICDDGECICNEGYEGDGLDCTDIDGCAGEPCFPGAECMDEPAPGEGYTCGDCPAGYEGDGQNCADADGCAGAPCFAGVECTDVPAPGEGFGCGACPAGYEGDGQMCSDVDGCAVAPCYPGVVCTDVPAPGDGFDCGDCPAGTFGDGINCVVANMWEIGDQSNSSNLGPYFRANGYVADANGFLSSFSAYLGNATGCNLDFYVLESATPGGALTQLWRNTVVGQGTGWQPSGPVDLPITSGMYYALGVGWNCSLTYYWNNSGTYSNFDAGIGIFNNTRWDNSYPGASDQYLPPNIGGSGNTAYPQQIFYAE